MLHCHRHLQPFAYLVRAACGKDPGYHPRSLLEIASRHPYRQAEVDTLDFGEHHPDARALGQEWHHALREAAAVGRELPADKIGACVVTKDASLYRSNVESLVRDLREEALRFHEGSMGGSWPTVLSP